MMAVTSQKMMDRMLDEPRWQSGRRYNSYKGYYHKKHYHNGRSYDDHRRDEYRRYDEHRREDYQSHNTHSYERERTHDEEYQYRQNLPREPYSTRRVYEYEHVYETLSSNIDAELIPQESQELEHGLEHEQATPDDLTANQNPTPALTSCPAEPEKAKPIPAPRTANQNPTPALTSSPGEPDKAKPIPAPRRSIRRSTALLQNCDKSAKPVNKPTSEDTSDTPTEAEPDVRTGVPTKQQEATVVQPFLLVGPRLPSLDKMGALTTPLSPLI